MKDPSDVSTYLAHGDASFDAVDTDQGDLVAGHGTVNQISSRGEDTLFDTSPQGSSRFTDRSRVAYAWAFHRAERIPVLPAA